MKKKKFKRSPRHDLYADMPPKLRDMRNRVAKSDREEARQEFKDKHLK